MTTKKSNTTADNQALDVQLHGSRLTLSFPDAAQAAVWQVDLSVFSLMGFSLQSTKGSVTLLFNGDDLPAQQLAVYPSAAKAEAALAILNNILKSYYDAPTSMRAAPEAISGAGIARWLGKWVLRLLVLAVILGLGWIAWGMMQPDVLETPPLEAPAVVEGPPPVTAEPAPPPPQGVPLSAEDMLAE